VGPRLTARVLIAGCAGGEVLASDTPLSLWGGLDVETGRIIDCHHPLEGQLIRDRVLVLPGGRGSSAASAMLLEALVAGTGPKALLLGGRDEVLTIGAVVAEALFGIAIPVVELDPETFAAALGAHRASIESDGQIRFDFGKGKGR
jgi:predicted aconitase with swiveling domain